MELVWPLGNCPFPASSIRNPTKGPQSPNGTGWTVGSARAHLCPSSLTALPRLPQGVSVSRAERGFVHRLQLRGGHDIQSQRSSWGRQSGWCPPPIAITLELQTHARDMVSPGPAVRGRASHKSLSAPNNRQSIEGRELVVQNSRRKQMRLGKFWLSQGYYRAFAHPGDPSLGEGRPSLPAPCQH